MSCPSSITYSQADLERVLEGSLVTSKAVKPECYSGLASENLIEWLNKFDIVARARNWNNQRKLENLPLYLTDSAFSWYTLLVKDDPDLNEYEEVIELMKEQFLPCDRTNTARAELGKLKQGREPTRTFLLKVRKLCQEIDADMKESEIMFHMGNCVNPYIAREVEKSSPECVTEYERLAKKIEASYLIHPDEESDKIDKLTEKIDFMLMSSRQNDVPRDLKQWANGGRDTIAPVARREEKHPNFFAGRNGYKVYDRQSYGNQRNGGNSSYPRQERGNRNDDMRCYNCNRFGHMQRDCRLPKRQTEMAKNNGVRAVNAGQAAQFFRTIPKTHTLHALNYSQTSDMSKESMLLPLTLDKETTIFSPYRYNGIVDTGAAFTIISSRIAAERGFLPKPVQGFKLVTPHQHTEIQLLGKIDLIVGYPDSRARLEFPYRKQSIKLTVLIAVMPIDILIGNDFIAQTHMWLEFTPNKIDYGWMAHNDLPVLSFNDMEAELGDQDSTDTPNEALVRDVLSELSHQFDFLSECAISPLDDDADRKDSLFAYKVTHSPHSVDFLLNGAAPESNPDNFMFMPVSVYATRDKPGIEISAIIDSGAQMTLIEKGMCDHLGIIITPYDGPAICMPTSKHLPIIGSAAVTFSYKIDSSISQTPLIAMVFDKKRDTIAIASDVLLGIDFLRAARIFLYPSIKAVGKAGNRGTGYSDVNCYSELLLANVVVTYAEAVTANSDPDLKGRTESENVGTSPCSNSGGVPEPAAMTENENYDQGNKLKRPQTLNLASVRVVPTLTFEQIREKEENSFYGIPLAKEENLSQSISDLISELPENLKHLDPDREYRENHNLMEDVKERSCEIRFGSETITVGEDLDAEQTEQLLSLLREYRHCFTFPGDPIGTCDLYPHVINTGKAFPTYRMPYAHCLTQTGEQSNSMLMSYSNRESSVLLSVRGHLHPTSSPKRARQPEWSLISDL